MNPLQNISLKWRAILYFAGYIFGLLNAAALTAEGAIAASINDWTPPVWMLAVQAVLVLLSTQLNLLAGSNLPALQDVVQGEVVAVDDDVAHVIERHVPKRRRE